MARHYPPKYRYALFTPWDKKAFYHIKEIARRQKFPEILGTQEDKSRFLSLLIRTQKSLHDWRQFLKDILDQIGSKGFIDTESLLEKYASANVNKNIPAWVTYKEDKIVFDFMNDLDNRKVDFLGTEREIGEFVVRFTLGQLGHDWESTIMMIWEMLGRKNKIKLRDLNAEMKHFDYLGLFRD